MTKNQTKNIIFVRLGAYAKLQKGPYEAKKGLFEHKRALFSRKGPSGPEKGCYLIKNGPLQRLKEGSF